MSTWFYRDGTPANGILSLARDTGTAMRWQACSRCGGAGGADKWKHTGWTCYQCGGNRGYHKDVPIYKAEKLAKLNATQAKAAATRLRKHLAKKAAERQAAREARRGVFMAQESVWRRAWAFRRSDRFIADLIKQGLSRKPLTDGQLAALAPAVDKAEAWKAERDRKAAERAAQRHVGRVGDRLEAVATIEKRIVGGDPYSRWGAWSLKILRTEAGDVLSTFGTIRAKEGDKIRIRFTVKDHARNTKTGAAETKIERVKILEEMVTAEA